MAKFLVPLFFLLYGCSNSPLPYPADIANGKGQAVRIANFSCINQNSDTVTNKTLDGKIYVADFIFLSCATICPKMNTEMLKVYKAFEKEERILFISHTIDPKNDSIPRLKSFSDALGVNSNKWHFVTGPIDSIYALAEKSYFTTVYADSSDSRNFIHGGGLFLVDKNRQIRGVYDGTIEKETIRLLKDIKLLLKEQY